MKEDNTCPCRHCADRVIGCHGNCKKYMEWSTMRRQRSEDIRKIKDAEFAESEYKYQAMKRMRRGR